jgi:DNA-binding MarR family transcriptional regulator
MVERLPLSTLLSQALVAFTIEFDNEAEHRTQHWTTVGGRSGAPRGAVWLVSQAMWVNVMRFVPDDGVRVDELHRLARTAKDSLVGLQRWRYVVVSRDAGDRPGQAVVRPTAAGRRAQEVWRPLAGLIEQRWRQRLGAEELDRLRAALVNVVDRLDVDLPDYLPIVYPTQNGKAELPDPAWQGPTRPGRKPSGADLDLSALLSRALLAFTLDFEAESRISLSISANPLRVLDERGVRPRDLPRLTGVSKEANAMAVGFLERRECVTVEPDPSADRGKVVRLTPKGVRAQAKYRRVLGDTERQWRARFGDEAINHLRAPLEGLVGGPDEPDPPLRGGLQPYPDGWRASVREPETRPHHPMVLHRGGYPDGS